VRQATESSSATRRERYQRLPRGHDLELIERVDVAFLVYGLLHWRRQAQLLDVQPHVDAQVSEQKVHQVLIALLAVDEAVAAGVRAVGVGGGAGGRQFSARVDAPH
jgi:hypothetical protein